MQLAVKQAAFACQQMTRGVIDTSPLKNMVYEHKGSKQYIIEQPRVAADGTPISSGRIIKAEDYSQSAKGIARLDENGKVIYQACFAAGTLVHTEQGPLPIEKVRPGTRVLSQPENGGETAYKPVINTVAHLDQQVHAVQVKVEGSDELTTLITTPNHPFWVQERLVHDQHWLAAEHLEPGMVLQIAGGGAGANAGEHIAPSLVATRYATVYANGLIRHTQHAHIGFAADDRVGVGMVLDLTDPKHVHLVKPEQASELGSLQLGQPFLTPVYNFSVDEFRTYYVGNSAVWVHNTCDGTRAVDAVAEKAAIEGECFSGETFVVVEPWEYKRGVTKFVTDKLYIERIEVGDTVLSRCETTGEMAYKQVTKVFSHGWRTTSDILFDCAPEFHQKYPNINPIGFTTTANHPFWVQDKGWTKVCDLQPGDEMLTYDGIKATVKQVDLNISGEDVYNLEVEDFHTYFVGSPGIWVHNKSPLKFDRLNPNVVPDPKPQWTPLHDSEVVLVQRKATLEQRKAELNAITTKTPDEVKELKDINRELTETTAALQEIYVGDAAVWVHNSGCPKETALATVSEKIVSLDKGKVEGSQFCFAAGTLVYTKNGLVPIEQINVGDWVLSRHDNNTGKQAYKRVLKTIQSDETKPIIMLRYYSELDEKICQLYVTNEHPIFVKDDDGEDVGWWAASRIAYPCKLVSFDGTPIEAFEKCTLWVTPNHGVAWGQSRVHDYGPLVDFNGSAPTILEGRTSEEAMGGMSATFETIVYNLEVEDFHTYYVGELGIWVHNTSSEQKAVLEQRKSELNAITTKTPAEVKELKDVNRELTETNTALQEIQPRKAQGRVINRIRSCDL